MALYLLTPPWTPSLAFTMLVLHGSPIQSAESSLPVERVVDTLLLRRSPLKATKETG